MNIKQAKQEIANTLRAYLLKDEQGDYRFPVVRQRPILLMGPPGIGKTAILEQVARECGVGLVAYTLTHHTRQSAVGLPHIEKRCFEGREMSVTEYTMSEIIASIYTYMDKTGKREGILFLDEVNCVSETLAPTMLQLLQNKTFGCHKVPEGWILVTAGNPPEYNKSVREFDIATLDRVRTIPVEADCGVWLEYAQTHGVHGAIRSYLSIRPEHFYLVEDRAEGKFFVTARGWEDLSEILRSYELLNVPVTEALVSQYLQKQEVARDFGAYYQLYRKYDTDYGIGPLLEGKLTREQWEEKAAMAAGGGFEERFTVVQLLADGLDGQFRAYSREQRHLTELHSVLQRLKRDWGQGPGALAASREKAMEIRKNAGILEPDQEALERWVNARLEAYELELKKNHIRQPEPGFALVRQLFSAETAAFAELTAQTAGSLQRAFRFAERSFGEGQELVLLMTDLTRSPEAMAFISANGSEEFLRHSEVLDSRSREKALLEQCRKLME